MEGRSLRGHGYRASRKVRWSSSEHPAVSNGDLTFGLSSRGAVRLHLLDHIQALHHTAEHDVFPVEPAGEEDKSEHTSNLHVKMPDKQQTFINLPTSH